MPNDAPRVLVVKLSAIGDCLLATPALAALRRGLGPGARIDWAVHPHCAPVVDGNPHLNQAIRIARRGWWRRLGAARRTFRATGYDVVLDQQGLMKSAVLARMAGAREVVGPRRPREPLAARLYTRWVDDDPAAHVVAVYLHRAAAVGAAWDDEPPMLLPVSPADEDHAAALLTDLLGPIAALNPGAGRDDKQWPPDRFAALAADLAGTGWSVVLTGGPGDVALTDAVLAALPPGAPAPRDLAGRTTLNQLGAVFRRCGAFVGGDTGPMHLAQASGCPTVALFGPTDPAILGPRLPMHRTLDAWAAARNLPPGGPRPRAEGAAALAGLAPAAVADLVRSLG